MILLFLATANWTKGSQEIGLPVAFTLAWQEGVSWASHGPFFRHLN